MKLWLKISLANTAVLLVVVIACGVLLLLEMHDNILSLTTEQALSEQRKLVASFGEMITRYLDDDSDGIVRFSATEYFFGQLADHTSVLVGENETIYSMVAVKPEELLPVDFDFNYRKQQTLLTNIDGRRVLIAGSGIKARNESYRIYVVKDITTVFDIINATILRFILICGTGITVGTATIIFLIRKGWGTLQVETHITELEQTNQRLQLFIGGITHELKTPMTSVIIHSDTLLSADLNGESARTSLVHINEQCKWLERLSQKLLKLITLDEEIKVKPEKVRGLFDDVSMSVVTKPIIECGVDTMQLDRDLMKSLLINLIDNAGKASSPEQSITLRAYDNIIEVSDSGKGIPANEIDKITEPFYMLDRSRNKEKGGIGLGLALVKRIADAHGARLQIISEVGVGTTVRLILTKD
jgi:signal transduction histidine kinase